MGTFVSVITPMAHPVSSVQRRSFVYIASKILKLLKREADKELRISIHYKSKKLGRNATTLG